MLDCYRDVPLTFRMFASIFTGGKYLEVLKGGFLELGITAADYVIVLIAVIIVFSTSMVQRKGGIRERLFRRPAVVQCAVIALLLITIIIFGAYGVGYDSSQFIYNQF